MSLDISSLYILELEGKRGSFSAGYVSDESSDSRLTYLERLFLGTETPDAPVLFCQTEGSRLYDLLLSTIPSYLASARLFDALEAAVATGWSRYPIELRGKTEELIEGYSGLVVTGRCGPLLLDQSREETRVGVSGSPYKVKIGLYFDESAWDRSDVFSPLGTTFVFVSDKVKRAMEEAKVSGARLTRLSEFERLW